MTGPVTLAWTGAPVVAHGVVERTFVTSSRMVPGAMWRADGHADEQPLILLGHGGTEHKQSAGVRRIAAVLVAGGFTVAAIDGPMHGDRRPAAVADADDMAATGAAYLDAIRGGDDAAVSAADSMVRDWREALAALVGLPELRSATVGYWGLSMGGRFGVPLLAEEPRIAAAVTGLVGTNAGSYILPAARRIEMPLLFIAMWDDELFPVAGAIELFAAMPATDRRLHVFPGPHTGMPRDEEAVAVGFLRTRLL